MRNFFRGIHLPDARGYIAIASFALCVMVIWIMKEDATVREDEFFQTIATILVANGWMSVVAWAFQATKSGGELAEKNQQIVDRVANHKPAEPLKIEEPVQVVEVNGAPDTDGELKEEDKL